MYREGNDGPWSTFTLRIGTPEVLTRVHISTAIPNTWVVISEACSNRTCTDTRGGTPLFNQNSSTTWDGQGIYDLYFESNLNYTGPKGSTLRGRYGLDKVGLDYQGATAPTLDGQVIAGFVTDQFYLGYLGVNPQPTNFSNFDNPIPSFFQTLKTKSLIPSLSYSYTAGNQYRMQSPKALKDSVLIVEQV